MIKILCVEDDYVASYVLHQQIERMGYFIIDKLDNGEDALELCEWNRPDLILMDITLNGELDGVETAKRIIEEEEIPVIFITGNSDPAVKERALEMKPMGYFTKPFELKDLQTTIERVANQRT
ncbi:response regulator [Balneolaceae bacterium ANBcel3]|nr:response regulator [Balneolaceae bacterium ANBcel3]